MKKVIDILKKEIQNNFRNNSVFGGLSFFVKNLIKNSDNFPEVLMTLLDYDNLNIENRKKLIYSVLPVIEKHCSDSVQEILSEEEIEEIFSKVGLENFSIQNQDTLSKSIELFSYELGINRRTINRLKKSGIGTIWDLVWFFPKEYSDRTKPIPIPEAINNQKAYVIVNVISSHEILTPGRKKIKIIKYDVKDSYGYPAELVFFNQDYIVHYIKPGNKLKVFGRVIKNRGYQILPEEWDFFGTKTLDFDRIVPIYSTSINQKKIRILIYRALKIVYKQINDCLFPFLTKFSNVFTFSDLRKAIVNIHFPSNFEELESARNRIALEEIIYTQILMNSVSKKSYTPYKVNKDEALKSIAEISLPFELTKAQKRVISEIVDDLSSGKACRRLVQGDVGAGKTIICILICYAMIKHGYQSCVMAPTEILATQHYNNFRQILPSARIELLTSKIRGKKREEIFEKLKTGEIDILVGTHALIGEKVEFKNLALIVVDEQHKFGVNQRIRLYSKSEYPHLIVMSATPIPRTLALTVYSDLDISVIDELPPGRKKTITEIYNYKDIHRVYDFVRQELDSGRQAYIVCPSIYDNPKVELKNVEEIYKEVSNYFKSYKVAYLHGRMSNKEKDEIMQKFRNQDFSILVSTTVIEVGIDVPNANVIVILDSDRFGLSQLHQLRGRVKRSSFQPYCFLVTSKNLSYSAFSKSVKRLSILKYYEDGFKIAEKDLELRGPGEVLGYKQHGFTEFKVLNPIKDFELIKFSNKLARVISKFVDKFDFLKAKIKDISLSIEKLGDTI